MTNDKDDAEAHIAANVRAIREAQGMSQARLAELMTGHGYSWQQVTTYKVEKGERRLYLAESATLASVLGVELDDLLSGDRRSDRFRDIALKTLAESVIDAVASLGVEAVHHRQAMRVAGRDDSPEIQRQIVAQAIYAHDYAVPGVAIHEFEIGLQLLGDAHEAHRTKQ